MKRQILLVTVCMVIVYFSKAQLPQWQKNFGGTQEDIANVSVQTADHGYIIGGTSRSGIDGNKTENAYGYRDYWILKLDSTGSIQWQKDFGGSQDDVLSDIIQTADGGYLLGGTSKSDISGDKSESNLDTTGLTYDIWIIKLDNTGAVEWDRTFGTDWYDYLSVVRQTSDGGYLIGGSALAGISGNKTSAGVGDMDCWIIKTDNAGVVQWQKSIGGMNDDEIEDLEFTSDGGVVILSYTASDISGDKTENGYGGMDYWVIKLDSMYNIQWDKTYGGDGDDFSHSIEQTSDGGFIVAGSSLSIISGNKTTTGDGQALLGWLLKIDSAGNSQWQKNFGGNSTEHLRQAHQVPGGGYILGIDADSRLSGNKTDPQQGYWIVKLDSSGNIQWQNALGGEFTRRSHLTCLNRTDDGSYLLTGYSNCGISVDKTEPNYGDWDYWIIKLSDNMNNIGGNLFIDANNNQVQDVGEFVVPGKMVLENTTGTITFSQVDGQYAAYVSGPGSFIVAPAPLTYYNATPLTHAVSFTGTQQSNLSNDFAFESAGSTDDLEVSMTPYSRFRPGFSAFYIVNFKNSGTTTLNGTVTFYPDSLISFVSSSLTPQLVTTDSIVWNVGTLTPYQSGSLVINNQLLASAGIGILINSMTTITPVNNDATPGNNQSAWEVYTTAAIDPNLIVVDQAELETTQLANPPFLEYIIYFQNSGNDTAFNITVVNPVDNEKADLETFELVSSSFPVNIEYVGWEQNLKFQFNNIQLPDSNINEQASHGFIRYRIKPKSTLIAGDSISNTAYIYFDYNDPVKTNVATTKIVMASGIASLQPAQPGTILFPNPATDILTIKWNTNPGVNENVNLTVYDITGRVVQENKNAGMNQQQSTINISKLPAGVYLLHLNAGLNEERKLFVKQ